MRRAVFLTLVGLVAGMLPTMGAAGATLPGFGDIVVDPATNHVFVSSGKSASSITVFDLNGAVVKTITGEPGASGMVVDGGNLYVLLANGAAIDVIDTTTLTKTDSFTVPAPSQTGDLVMAGGKLWFGSGVCGQWEGKLNSLDPATGLVQSLDGPTNGSFYCPALSAGPGNPNFILAWDEGLSSGTIYKYDVSTGAAVAAGSGRTDLSNLRDLAVSPDGATIFAASGSPYEIRSYNFSDFTQSGVAYPTGPYPNAVEVSPNGAFLGAGVDASYDPDVFVFPIGDSTPTLEFDFGQAAGNVLPDGIAFSPDSQRVFAVIAPTGGSPTLRVLGTEMSPTSIDLSLSSRRVRFGRSVTVTADLKAPGSMSGQKLSIYKTPYGATKKLVKTGTVSSTGVLKASVNVSKKTIFSAEYLGDAQRLGSTSPNRTVEVKSVATTTLLGAFGRDGKYKLYRYGETPTQRGKVAPNHAGQPVLFTLQAYDNGSWRTIDSGSVLLEADSTATAFVLGGGSPHNYRSRVSFSGDAEHLGDKSSWAYFKYKR
ncbi:MAG: hypothetical protein ACRDI3_01390 [Actinomycetota bacterium]